MPRDAIDGFSFEGQGTLDRIDTFTAKSGKEIMTIVLRVGGTYPQLVPVKVFGRTADEAGTWKVGNVLRVSGRLGGRDWQGKVFGDIVATRVDVVGKGSASAADDNRHAEEDAQQQMDPDELPF